jgi:hypothetical protein
MEIKICINYIIILRGAKLLHMRAGPSAGLKNTFRMMFCQASEARHDNPIRLVHLNRKFAENLLHIKKQFICQEMWEVFPIARAFLFVNEPEPASTGISLISRIEKVLIHFEFLFCFFSLRRSPAFRLRKQKAERHIPRH